ncbi:hypothetical protein [Demetria terragena]|uniref:hypothetical protein n=1 Tax=Demetria terragena TaxID=63959 RepID=UPI00036BFD6A|nr:hypothetical protein [Demetria terragena]
MSSRTIRALAKMTAVAGALATTVAVAPTAEANDVTLLLRDGGKVVAKAWYDDSVDTLCVRSQVKGTMATVQIGPIDGAPRATARDAGFGKSTNCTGNLSIPEDRRFWLRLESNGRSTDTTFFT